MSNNLFKVGDLLVYKFKLGDLGDYRIITEVKFNTIVMITARGMILPEIGKSYIENNYKLASNIDKWLYL